MLERHLHADANQQIWNEKRKAVDANDERQRQEAHGSHFDRSIRMEAKV
jgi:hypothetical protein